AAPDPEKPALLARVAALTADVERLRTEAARADEEGRARQAASAEAAALRDRVSVLEREAEQHFAASAASAGGAPGKPDPAVLDAATALGDALAGLRTSLRSANDEAAVLATPPESVQVVVEGLTQATEHLESARSHLRD